MTGTHLLVLSIGLSGLVALALATERQAEHVLRRLPAPRWRHLLRAVGWLLLSVALAIALRQWGAGVGLAQWLGWLSLAALALVFGLPKWPGALPAPTTRERRPRTPGQPGEPAAARRAAKRWTAAALLVTTVAVFAVALVRTGTQPLLRDDALRGEVGPWRFTLAEADHHPPEVVDMDVPLKAFQLQFCEACGVQIRAAYLKVNRPRSSRTWGMAFEDEGAARAVHIQMPSTVRADSELWLTVVGKDGQVHQRSWRMDEASPATVDWFERQRNAHDHP